VSENNLSAYLKLSIYANYAFSCSLIILIIKMFKQLTRDVFFQIANSKKRLRKHHANEAHFQGLARI
jgi:hypothetical protein